MGVFKRWRVQKNGKRKGYWYIRYTADGKERWESVGEVGQMTKALAQQRLEERKRQIRLGQLDMIGAKIPLLREFAHEYLAYVRDVKCIRSHERSRQALTHFTRFYGGKKLIEVSGEGIDIYKRRRMEEGAKPGTVARELVVIRNLFHQARKWHKFFGDNPVSISGLPEVHDHKERILTAHEEERLLSSSPPYLRNILTTALNTGMRKMEILSLRWEWIDLENNVITIPQTNTKSKKTRRIPISSRLREVLLEQRLGGSEFVFPSEGSQSGHMSWLRRSWSSACKRAGLYELRFHDLRHTAATRLVEAGIPLHAVAKLLGHSTIKMTERYSHPEASIQLAVEILANFTRNRAKSVARAI